jgi:hypothetical protein
VKLNPTADAHVRDGSSANTNFGGATTIEVQTSSTAGLNRDAYFKFDLTNVGDINNVKLRIYAALSAAGSVATSVYPVTNTTWTETAINWNNRPAVGSPILNNVTVNSTSLAWYELDVTNYITGERKAGRNVVTLALHNQSNSTSNINLNSKEAASNKPELAIVTPETAFVTGKTLGTIRNNLTGFVGMKFTLGAAPVTVTSLGRLYVAGNTGTHTVKIVNAATGSDVAGASVSINTCIKNGTIGFQSNHEVIAMLKFTLLSPLRQRFVLLMIIPSLLVPTAACALVQRTTDGSYPTVCYVLPDKYVGAFQLVLDEKSGVEVRVKDGCYTYEIPKEGVLKVRTFQPLEQWHKELAIYRNGEKVQPADSTTPPDAVALRGLGRSRRNDGPLTQTSVIGTEEQAKRARKDLQEGNLRPGQ